MGFAAGDAGKLLLVAGLVLAAIGGILVALNRLGVRGLPGDVSASHGGVSFVFPVVTCVVVSIVLTVVINVIVRLRQ